MGFHIQWDICSACITSSARPVTARSPHLMSQMFYCIAWASQCIMIQRFEMEVWGNQLFADPSVWRDTFNDLLDSHLACDRSICPLMAYAMRFHTNLLLPSEVSFGAWEINYFEKLCLQMVAILLGITGARFLALVLAGTDPTSDWPQVQRSIYCLSGPLYPTDLRWNSYHWWHPV